MISPLQCPKIAQITALEILDSRGWPTIEVSITTDQGIVASASVPSGASTGENEVHEMRDNDNRYYGKGVMNAVEIVKNKISTLVNEKSFSQTDFDECLIAADGTNNKDQFGGNTILACSLAMARATAMHNKIPLYEYINHISGKPKKQMPIPMINIINGGKHADNALDIQEFMVMPIPSNNNFSDAIRMGSEIFHSLKKVVQNNGYNANVGDEGGFAPAIGNTKEAIEMILDAVKAAGYKPATDVLLALDVAASEFYVNGMYDMQGVRQQKTPDEMIELYSELVEKYPIFSIEDPMSEHDKAGFVKITQALGNKIQLVGDDLFVTNPKLIKKYAEQKMCNAVLIKPNQIGTLSETIEAIHVAQKFGYNAILSHRSGETEDSIIADIAVGTGVGQIKTGSMSRSDRLAKYNQLLRIANNDRDISFNPSKMINFSAFN